MSCRSNVFRLDLSQTVVNFSGRGLIGRAAMYGGAVVRKTVQQADDCFPVSV